MTTTPGIKIAGIVVVAFYLVWYPSWARNPSK